MDRPAAIQRDPAKPGRTEPCGPDSRMPAESHPSDAPDAGGIFLGGLAQDGWRGKSDSRNARLFPSKAPTGM